ncbi:hypothetical protein SCALM49S_06892 [Streptomyces californicus]
MHGHLKRRSVVWGNTAGLIAFATETSLVFLLTLYLQEVLGYSALATGLAFGVLGVGTVVGGVLGGRAVGRFGNRRAIVLGGTVQAGATLMLVALGTSGAWIWLLLAATFISGVGNILMIVGFMVTATSGLPDAEQGRATGLATMTQQVGIALGIPVMSAVVTARTGATTGPDAVLSGVSTAVLVNAALVLLGALLAGRFPDRGEAHEGCGPRRALRAHPGVRLRRRRRWSGPGTEQGAVPGRGRGQVAEGGTGPAAERFRERHRSGSGTIRPWQPPPPPPRAPRPGARTDPAGAPGARANPAHADRDPGPGPGPAPLTVQSLSAGAGFVLRPWEMSDLPWSGKPPSTRTSRSSPRSRPPTRKHGRAATRELNSEALRSRAPLPTSHRRPAAEPQEYRTCPHHASAYPS